MRKLMLAGAVALAMMSASQSNASDLVVTDGHLAYLHSALNLRADQERSWGRVVATIHAIAHQQNAAAATLDASAMRRLTSAAMPLLRQLDSDQKREAMRLARALGISSFASLL